MSQYVCGIDLEYYIDEEHINDSSQFIGKIENARRTNEVNDNSKVKSLNISNNITNINSVRFNEDEIENDDIILAYNVAVRRGFLQNYSTTVINDISTFNYTKRLVTNSANLKWTTTRNLLDLKTFNQYDYKEDENEDLYQPLRYKTFSDTSDTKTATVAYNVTSNSNFFNLEPAFDFDNESENLLTNKVEENIWYVPYEFPCWELPTLYGELGVKKKKSDVFLIYGGKLMNVIGPSSKTKSNYKADEPFIPNTVNKWCEVEPCYGDHTLCLFPNKHISNICDKEYKVIVPSTTEQFTITNTLNSMRNRVANGLASKYSHLPTAANMLQVTYDYDLEKISKAWLRQCIPGVPPCSALDGNIVTQLECTKYMKYCCLQNSKTFSQCVPKTECFIYPIIGCLHIWFSSAGKHLTTTDINCGRATVKTFNTVQLLWAKTTKIGCAYGERTNGDIRVICNFSPGAPFFLDTKLFCGLIAHSDIDFLRDNENITNPAILSHLGIHLNPLKKPRHNVSDENALSVPFDTENLKSTWGIKSLTKVYQEGWVRKQIGDRSNGTKGMVARLVAKYKFIDESESRCDTGESVYQVGAPGSSCVEKSRTFHVLCYDFRDPTPGYRLIAIIAPIILFSLILYDLFSGVVRQTSTY
ncbi:uncharacterized protein LOC123658002 [Melitaea cinxia]|uniref:uncharacterized protein LOC123658002 n=1 Tax=Melitaea cinxia TaxID=113334 RepID=UPI001E26F9AA|nr:uncharacterized protein LOC123658002 [Melitaea cinxia]